MRTHFAVEYILPGPNNQVLYRFTNRTAADEYLNLMTRDPMYRSSFRVVPVQVYDSMTEALESNTPTCADCGADGHVVETITDMLVWHHTDAEVEDLHDFVPHDGRPQIIFDPETP